MLPEFLALYTHRVNGSAIPFAEFRKRFHAWLPRDTRPDWTDYHLSRALRELGVPVGSRTANKVFVGNLSWEREMPDGEFMMVAKRKGTQRRLVRV